MSKFVNQGMVVGAALAALAGLAMADGHVKFMDATGIYNGTDGTGGAFVISQDSGDNGLLGGLGLSATSGGEYGRGSFYTFCMEWNENVNFSTAYYTQLAKSSMFGGVSGGSGNPVTDPLGSETALLYRTFRDGGSFGGSIGVIDSSAETTALQFAIWYSEGEKNWSQLSPNAQYLYNWAAANADGSLYGVRVLRMWASYSNGVYSGARQDLLTLVPVTPAAYAGIGTLAAMGMFAIARRRQLMAN
jgi:hypothetical protein